MCWLFEVNYLDREKEVCSVGIVVGYSVFLVELNIIESRGRWKLVLDVIVELLN